jgi:hypothetical protein
MTVDKPLGPLSDDELALLSRLLARYADFELDQFEHWRIESRFGPVFIDISRQTSYDADGIYATIWPPPCRGRSLSRAACGQLRHPEDMPHAYEPGDALEARSASRG